MLDGVAFGGLIADEAFDTNAIIADLNQRGAKIVISQHPRRIATRYDRRTVHFTGFVHLAAAMIWLR